MNIGPALQKHLTTTPGVSGLVGDRVYPKKLPQPPTLPAIAYHRTAGAPEYSHDGDSSLVVAIYRFELYAATYQQDRQLSEQVVLALTGFKGTMGGAGGANVEAAYVQSDDDGDVVPADDDELKQYCWGVDLEIWYNPSPPDSGGGSGP